MANVVEKSIIRPKPEGGRGARHPILLLPLIAVQALLAFISLISGVLMLQDHTGSAIGGQSVLSEVTRNLPFIHDYVPIGIWLITIYGIFPIINAIGLWSLKRWAWFTSVFLGAVVVTWISAEILMFYSLGFTFFYPLIGGIGIAILGLSLSRSVRRSLNLQRRGE
jgi:hypothetical protein